MLPRVWIIHWFWYVRLPLRALAFPRTRGPTDCLGCGYDLRGVRDRACPECGATVN